MPITRLQARILKCIAANRSPESYLAGATVLHRAKDSPRFSQDLDFFHDVADSVARCAEADAATLRDAGYTMEWLMRTPNFHRAIVTSAGTGGRMKLEWAEDSAFRFFPVIRDARCGYRLHDADAAVNKVLALAGRHEARDYVDVIHLDATYLSLGALAWAACGKDPGFTPEFLLDQASRHVAYTQADLDRLTLRKPLDARELKLRWLAAVEAARRLIVALPPAEAGCLYLDRKDLPTNPVPGSSRIASLVRHRGSVRGAWPTITPVP